MKIALAQINPMVGDIQGNSAKIINLISEARSAGASLAVFPELAVMGYPPRDLLLKPRFVRANVEAVHRIAESCRGIAALIGFVESNTDTVGRQLRNAAAYCTDGQVKQVRYKSLLPTYDVFDEQRYFEPGPEVAVVEHAGVPVGVSICEDLWNDEQLIGRRLYQRDPIGQLAAVGAKFIINMSASPFWQNKYPFRMRLFGNQAKRCKLPLVFVNQVGGNDELIFDGASAVIDAKGELAAQARAFEEDLLVVDLISSASDRCEPYPKGIAAVYEALVLGTRDYVRKCGFKEAVLGLSGGIDSAVTAAIAAAALGPKAVTGVSMPSRYSSEHSRTDADALARNLGIEFKIIPIGEIHEAFENTLHSHFVGLEPDITEENIQARNRGAILMALSNKYGSLLLTTGNKSELAVGYCTLYGDMCGGLAVISDVPKMLVYQLAEYINERAGKEIIPRNTLNKPPSAELRPDQTDQDSLPPYDVLDVLLEQYITNEKSVDEIIAAGIDPDTVQKVVKLVDMNEYKRKQAAQGLKVTSRAFGVGRRMPIAAKFRY
ncbi:MAG: NAD+ synthase [Planctomycetota bacterium]|nr:MAG: NAD+ synthase [Planctomycetota bacterium]